MQFCIFACYSRSQDIQQHIDGTTIHLQLFSEILFWNFLVIVVDLEPRLVWSWNLPCRQLCLLQYLIIKRVACFRRNLCRKNKYTICSVSSGIRARFKSMKHNKYKNLNVIHYPIKMFDVLACATKIEMRNM